MPQPERAQTSRTVLLGERGGKPVNGNDLRTEKASMTDEARSESARWNSVDWEKAEAHVNGLQTRIAKAAAEGKREKVRKLQRLLTNSRDAKLLAVRRVTTNKGKRTPGVDGELWDTPAKKARAARNLNGKGYKARPLRRVDIPKKGKRGKTRPLGIPTMHDRAMQALYALALEPVAEVTGDRHSYGFRKGRCAQDAGEQLFGCLSRRYDAQWVLEGDIKGCFDHISHEWLMANIPMDKKVLKQFLDAGYMKEGLWHETEEGTPQGGIISPVLANMALDGIDELLDARFHRNGKGKYYIHTARKYKVNFVRYADDFVVTAATREIAEEAKALIAEHLAGRGLELSEEKTVVTHIEDGFDFLGWNFRKFDGKLIMQPSKKSVDNFLREMHHVILRKGRTWSQRELVRVLTPKIRGFANYHRHACSKRTFSKIDHCIYWMLQRWARRRHPNKGGRWRHRKYWLRVGGTRYVFGKKDCQLPHMAWQHVVRHPMLKIGVNPYLNPEYFAERKAKLARRYRNSFGCCRR